MTHPGHPQPPGPTLHGPGTGATPHGPGPGPTLHGSGAGRAPRHAHPAGPPRPDYRAERPGGSGAGWEQGPGVGRTGRLDYPAESPWHANDDEAPPPDGSAGRWSTPADFLQETTPWQRAQPVLRLRTVNRLVELNSGHALHAWERRRRDPLSPHTLALIFADPKPGTNPRRPAFTLAVACRLFLATDEPRLPQLLGHMVDVLDRHLPADADPRTTVANWAEPMSPQAVLAAVAVSTLDTPTRSWADSQRRARSVLGVPGRCYLQMRDGARLLVDRAASDEYGTVDIRATAALADEVSQIPRDTVIDSGLADTGQLPAHDRAVWTHLVTLANLLQRSPHVH
jgi:hypothetical protein